MGYRASEFADARIVRPAGERPIKNAAFCCRYATSERLVRGRRLLRPESAFSLHGREALLVGRGPVELGPRRLDVVAQSRCTCSLPRQPLAVEPFDQSFVTAEKRAQALRKERNPRFEQRGRRNAVEERTVRAHKHELDRTMRES